MPLDVVELFFWSGPLCREESRLFDRVGRLVGEDAIHSFKFKGRDTLHAVPIPDTLKTHQSSLGQFRNSLAARRQWVIKTI
jgi:hypothetical protein